MAAIFKVNIYVYILIESYFLFTHCFPFSNATIHALYCINYLFHLGGVVLRYSRNSFAVVFIGSTLFALQQLSGINAIFYFSSTVFKSSGVPSNLANVCVGISNLAGLLHDLVVGVNISSIL